MRCALVLFSNAALEGFSGLLCVTRLLSNSTLEANCNEKNLAAANTMCRNHCLYWACLECPFRIQSVRSGSDEYPHVAWTNSSNTLLQPSLTIRQVKGILGPLDAVMNEAIEGTPSLSEEYSLRNDPILRHLDLVHPAKREEELH
jgi:hypothetical protein